MHSYSYIHVYALLLVAINSGHIFLCKHLFISVYFSEIEVPPSVQVQQSSTANIAEIGLLKEHTDEENAPATMIILLSSTARSGSSFIGETLASIDSAVFFFEPLHRLEKAKDPCIEDPACVSEYLSKPLKCLYDEEFEKWLKKIAIFLEFFNKDTLSCPKDVKEIWESCMREVDLRKACKNAEVRITKVIRARLQSLEPLMQSSDNYKIIHLYRDPRGSINSIRRFNWSKEVSLYCANIRDDIEAYDQLVKFYPDKVTQVVYDRFSEDPMQGAVDLFSFLSGNRPLPQSVVDYIVSHTGSTVKGSMSRTKNSTAIVQKWRKEIPEKYLYEIESNEDCQFVLERMGHTVFGSLDLARNLSIPLIETSR